MLNIIDTISQAGLFLSTALLAFIGYYQINKIREQSNADFIVRINKEFFYESEINRKLIKAIENRRPILKKHRGAFSEDDLRGYLRYFEMIERFIATGIISFELVNEMFGVYIARAWENQEVKNYVLQIRASKKDNRYFEHFEELAERILENEKLFRGSGAS